MPTTNPIQLLWILIQVCCMPIALIVVLHVPYLAIYLALKLVIYTFSGLAFLVRLAF